MIVGKTEIERRLFVTEVIENANYETYRFPPKMRLSDEYLEFVVKNKLYVPFYKARKYNLNQIIEFHEDWLEQNNSLLVLEEIDYMEKEWKIDLLKTLISLNDSRSKNAKTIRVIFSQDDENDLVELLSDTVKLSEDENRSPRQVIEQNLQVLSI